MTLITRLLLRVFAGAAILSLVMSVSTMAADLQVSVAKSAGDPGQFAADEIRREATVRSMTIGDDAQSTRVFINVEQDFKSASQSYRIRVTNEGRRVITISGGDQVGAMYGGLDLAEAIRFGEFESLKDSHLAIGKR